MFRSYPLLDIYIYIYLYTKTFQPFLTLHFHTNITFNLVSQYIYVSKCAYRFDV